MKRVAVIVAPGFEEGETLTICDILRRGEMTCDLVGLSEVVEGGHEIIVKCDKVLSEDLVNYDMVVLPGGYGGVDAMCQSSLLLSSLVSMNTNGKWIGAMCAAPKVLEKAGLLINKKFTAYRGYDEKIHQGTFADEKLVVDGNLVTSQGPACCYAFAYKLLDVLGGNSLAVKKRMVYFNAFDVKEDE